MKNALLKTQPRIILSVIVTISVLFLLAFSYLYSTQPKLNSTPKIFGNDGKNLPSTLSENQEGQSESTNGSTSTKLNVSVNQSTTNGETTGQAVVTVNENGEVKTFTSDLSDSVSGSDFKVKVSNGEVDFDIDFDQKSKSQTSINQSVEIENESD